MGLIEAPSEFKRVLGLFRDGAPGATIIVTAGLHGNELAGVRAAERVVDRLERERPDYRGRLVFLAGNLRALRERTRFIDLDLNRQWTPRKLARLMRDGPHQGAVEHAEQRALVEAIRDVIGESSDRIYFLDLHTSSAEGPPFLTIGDTLVNREFAAKFPLPVILGLEEQVDGSLLEFLNNYGIVTLGVEAGQHDDRRSVERLEAVLWLALVAAGFIDSAVLGDLGRWRRVLSRDSRNIPRVIEVRHRHAIEPGDRFRMDAGFANLQQVRRGQPLASDAHGRVVCPEDGLILLPLYQGKGNDGFFIAREFRPFWLRVSGALRRLRVARLVRLLPGVRRHRAQHDVLIANTKIARLYPMEIFHLLGFRKLRQEGVDLLVSRRRHDLHPPDRIEFP